MSSWEDATRKIECLGSNIQIQYEMQSYMRFFCVIWLVAVLLGSSKNVVTPMEDPTKMQSVSSTKSLTRNYTIIVVIN